MECIFDDNQGAEIGELHWVRLLDFANPDFLLGEYSITGGTGIIRYAEGYLKDSIGPDGDGVLVSNFFLCGSGCDKGKERDKGKGKGSYPRFSFTDQQQQHQQVMGGVLVLYSYIRIHHIHTCIRGRRASIPAMISKKGRRRDSII